MKRLLYILSVILTVGTGALSAQNLELPDESGAFAKRVDASYEWSKGAPANEKIYIQSDKPHYNAGDDIWFKLYLLNSMTHEESAESRFVYVELIDSRDSLYSRVKVKRDKYGFHNNIQLPDDIPAGDYTLRGYTQRMRNWSEDQFFSRKIYIANGEVQRGDVVSGGKIDLQFMPEGGALMAGDPQVIAFKAVGSDGLSREVEGVIYGEQSGEISYIKSRFKGMGSFTLVAEATDRYYAVVNEVGDPKRTFRVNLPKPESSGVTINAIVSGNYLIYKVAVSNDLDYNKIGVVMHSRGRTFSSHLLSEKSEIVRLPLRDLPEGLMTIALVNSLDSRTIAERLLFVPQRGGARAKITSDRDRYSARSRVELDVEIAEGGKPLAGSFALAVTDRSAVSIDTSDNIVTDLDLSSHLTGYIEGAKDYFAGNELQNRDHLDLLMLTHGWRRFSLSDMLKRRSKSVKIPAEVTQVMAGDLKGVLDGDEQSARLMITYPERGSFEYVTLDDRGRFSRLYDDLPDSTEMIIQAFGRRGESPVSINIAPEDLPEPRYSQSPERTTRGLYVANKPADQPEPTVAPERVELTFGEASPYTIDESTLDQYSGERVGALLGGFPGVKIADGKISVESVNLLGEPIVGESTLYLNDMVVELDFVDMLLADQVASIDLETTVIDTTTYSEEKPAVGVMRIRLKEGVVVSKDLQPLDYIHLKSTWGYKGAVEFYQPKYDVAEVYKDKTPDVRTTICWEPRIKIGKDGRAKVSFYTADQATIYDVVLEGVTADGQAVRRECAVLRK